MRAMASQIISVSIVYSTVCSGADQRANISIWWRHNVDDCFNDFPENATEEGFYSN